MAYSAPTTRSTSDLITAAIWNQDVVNNVAFLANPPACRVGHGSNQAMTHNTATTVTFTGTESFDTDTMHSTSTNPTRITFTTAGLYIVQVNGIMEAGSDYNWVAASICKNAVLAGEIISGMTTDMDTSESPAINFGGLYKFAAGDYVTLYIKQHNAAAASRNLLFLSDRSPIFSAIWVGLG